MKLEGQNLRLYVDFPETASITPRVEVLGGDYHGGDVNSVSSGHDLQLPLRPRCIDRPLKLPPFAAIRCAAETLMSNGAIASVSPRDALTRTPLLVTESGLNNVTAAPNPPIEARALVAWAALQRAS
jgi:hypothetical protein